MGMEDRSDRRHLRHLGAWMWNAIKSTLFSRIFLRVIAAGLSFSVFVECLDPLLGNWVVISQAHAYKVQRVCESVTSKKGVTEKCVTKLVKEKNENGTVTKSEKPKVPPAQNKAPHGAPPAGH